MVILRGALNILIGLARSTVRVCRNSFRSLRYRSVGTTFGKGVVAIECEFGKQVKIYDKAELCGVRLGDCSYIGPRSRLGHVSIGKFCCIGPDVLIGPGRHPSKSFVSSHPAFFSTRGQAGFTFVQEDEFQEELESSIGNDVWIGAKAIVLDGIHVGDGAIIGAGAVVTKDVPAFSIVVGVPARVLRYRFDEHTIKFLKNSRWWNRDLSWLRKNKGLFKDVELLKGHLDDVGEHK